MTASLLKDTVREIKSSFGRFFSILMIVAIGVAFFAGVKAAVPNMKHTADQYFDHNHLMDLQVRSTMGLTKEDINEIQNLKGIEGVYASNTKDVVTMVGSHQYVMKAHALPTADRDDSNLDYLNRVTLIEGRLPENSGECVIEYHDMRESPFTIGDTITLESGTSENLSDHLKTTEYTIVGFVKTPYYLSYEKGSSTLGSGKVNYYMMLPEDDFVSEIYSEVYLSVEGAREINSYEDAYFEVTDKVKQELEQLSIKQVEVRYQKIKQIAQDTLNSKMNAYEIEKNKFLDEIALQTQVLENTKLQIRDRQAEFLREQAQYERILEDEKTKLVQVKTQLIQAEEAYQRNVSFMDEEKRSLEEERIEITHTITKQEQRIAKFDEEISMIENQLEEAVLSEEERRQLTELRTEIQQSKQVEEEILQSSLLTQQTVLTRLDGLQKQAREEKERIESQRVEVENQEQGLVVRQQIASKELAKAQEQLRFAQEKYEVGMQTLDIEKAKGQEELDLAKEKLDKAALEIEQLATPKWYVLDRLSHYSYMDYGKAADRMDGIAKVFPLFFFIVAALVCLTTMTRMVDEQRSMIGTLKALGYHRYAIAFKYIAYAFIAGVFGSILGCLLGMWIFPMVIFNAWNLMYTLPSIQYVAQPLLAFSASTIVTGITVLAAIGAVYKELIETPSRLMRAKAPSAGKKIALERIPWLWKKFSFTQKVTFRNLFRYKKRFLMTVIGISGCTALLVSGFGIKDSISQIVRKQYEDIIKYDVAMNLQEELSLSAKDNLFEILKKDERISDIMGVTLKNAVAFVNGEQEALTILAPSDTEQFKSFVSLHSRTNNRVLELSNDGVLVSEKLAKNANVKIGDTIEIDDGDNIKREVLIQGIVENYIGHYIYLSPSYYKQIFQVRQENTTFIANMYELGTSIEEKLGQELMNYDEIRSISFYADAASNFSNIIQSLSFVVLVLVIAAGLLAFVVLYNLTNVNIAERQREIATIKVLGFYDLEVAEYVFRETLLLTIIGALCGFVLGMGLHQLIMNVAEMENVMFGRDIAFLSYVYAMGITLIFAGIVNFVMYQKLKHIAMVESLKSVE